MRIEHFAIYAEDTIELADWYCEKFGLKVVFRNEQQPPVFFVADESGMSIEIIGRPPRAQPIDFGDVFHFAFIVDDFDATVAELTAKGVPFEDEIQFADGAVRICYFADPAGNRGQVVYRSQPL
ncbi:Glyoxalase-like domain protein [Symmachiella dynata]|uniref:Glyoxalase-like domain protein n=1 Tax=Symmachiella dynata TaxID=2527995 RepID=A0A517ZM13_9PLAN|nr:VOC family protein [Symmachiella dynata]QDU43539.1 Glyoxalase-like domain protein [Symmachiella dynata]